MAEEVRTATEQLLSQAKGAVKQHCVYDGQDRLIAVYTAPIHVKQGEPCLITQYSYPNLTTTRIVNRVESNAVWNPDDQAGWETVETLPSPVL